MRIPVYQITIPEYNIKKMPNYKKIGDKIDELIKKHFMGKTIAIRCIGSMEHKVKSQKDLIRVIKKIGTDRYNSKRKGDRYENVENRRIDFFAWKSKINSSFKVMWIIIREFYRHPKKTRGYPVKIDIITIYDPKKLITILHRYKWRKDVKNDGFVFKNQENKKEALLGIIKIK